MSEPAARVPPALQVQPVDPQGHAALALLREAAVEARALYPDLLHPDAPWPTNEPTPDRGVYLVGFVGDKPVACGALRPLSADIAEVRRMFVSAAERRRGFAGAILSALEDRARGFGFSTLRLETGNRQPAAVALYESHGFHRMAPFGDYANDPSSICFEKRVADGRALADP